MSWILAGPGQNGNTTSRVQSYQFLVQGIGIITELHNAEGPTFIKQVTIKDRRFPPRVAPAERCRLLGSRSPAWSGGGEGASVVRIGKACCQ